MAQDKKPTVLIAEDNPDHQYITRELLELCGCRVIEAENGLEAFDLALLKMPDMILLDLKMPVLDGYEAVRRLREVSELRDTPIIAYTAIHSYSLTEGALGAGFDEYIVKPVNFEDMQKLVNHYLKEFFS